MTRRKVQAEVKKIYAAKGQKRVSMEKTLWFNVLLAIAEGADEPAGLAAEALQSITPASAIEHKKGENL